MESLIDYNDVYSLLDVNGFVRLHVADIDEIPRVDAVEVVRCRDCKHWDVHPINGRCILGKCLKLSRVMGNSSFCSYGERKDDGSDV